MTRAAPHAASTDQASRLRALLAHAAAEQAKNAEEIAVFARDSEGAGARSGGGSERAPLSAATNDESRDALIPLIPRAKTIAVASGKGGVGKTNLCVSLAAALARLGCRTVLLDGDLGLANADVLCGVSSAPGHFGQVLDGRKSLADIAITIPPGFTLIPGASGIARFAAMNDAEHARLIAALEPLESQSDAILIDCGAGVGPAVLSFLAAADAALIVVTPEPTSITDAYALMKCALQRHPEMNPANWPFMLVVNQAEHAAEAKEVHRRIASTAQRFLGIDVPLAGFVTFDSSVREAVRRRTPFIEFDRNSPASRDVRNLSGHLTRSLKLADAETKVHTGPIARLLRFMRPRG